MNSFRKVVKYVGKARFFAFVLGKCPRHGFVDIFIRAAEEREDFRDRVRDFKFVRFRRYLFHRASYRFFKFLIGRFFVFGKRFFHRAAEIFADHGDRTADKIPQNVRKIGVEAFANELPSDLTVVIKRHFVEHEIAHRIHAEKAGKIVRIDHVALGFAHFSVAH